MAITSPQQQQPVTVLHLCEHFGGKGSSLHGVATTFLWWIPAFDKNRYRALLCSRKGFDNAAANMVERGIRPLHLGYGKFDPRNLFALLRLIRRENVDIIHAHGYGAGLWAHLAALFHDIPVIIHEHCNYGTVPLYQRPVEFLLVAPRTKYAFAVSKSSVRFCIEQRHMRPDVVKLLYYGILLDNIPKADPGWIREFRRSRGIGDDDKVIGVVGRLESHKGHLDAFKALQLVLREIPRAHLWVVGDGIFADTLRQWVADHQLQAHVDFLGFQKDVLRVIQCFDVQLFPSHMEGTPNTMFEGMAVGNAFVATTADGQGEILEDGKTALMLAPGDVETMARHLVTLLNDKDLAARLKANVLERVKDFDGRRTIATLEETYDRIMAERRSR